MKILPKKEKSPKIAENGGEITKTKVCPHCGKEFIPTSNRQIFCTSEIITTPCLMIEEPPTVSKYGRMRERYLREHKKILYFNLLTSGKLYEHLTEIDTSVWNMAEYLIKETARKQGVTEQPKAEDMMRWLGLMNNIRAYVDDIVYS